jgi:hypothetical protein
MNLVGRIFVVLILILSVLFMAFAMAVYATHRNWHNAVVAPEVGYQAKLDKAVAENRALTDQIDGQTRKYNDEKKKLVQDLTETKGKLAVAEGSLKTLHAKEADLDKAKRDAVAAMNATQGNATSDRKELAGQRTNIEDARKDRDLHFTEVVRLAELWNQAVSEKDLLKKQTDELARDLAKADGVLRKFGLDKNKDYSDVPPVVDGIVTSVTDNGLVEISIGADMGLLKGHKLEVYRIGGGQSTYVGRIEVVKTAPDKSVCKIDPKYQNSNVTVNDRVASKID